MNENNITFCTICKIHFFPDFDNGTQATKCRVCGGELTDTGISYEEYKEMPKTKRCEDCKRNYPRMFINCPRCYNQLSKKKTVQNQQTQNKTKPKPQSITKPVVKQQPNVPKCPYCRSTNLKKISTTRRAVSFGMFGFASGKIGKQWHCNGCGSDF